MYLIVDKLDKNISVKCICGCVIFVYLFSVTSVGQLGSNAVWTWVKGDDRPFKYAVYGSKGISDAKNKPGSRRLAKSWTDLQGNFWLYGGVGYTDKPSISPDPRSLNDIWKYNPLTNEWTWMGGDSTYTSSGFYGTLGVASTANNPPVRDRPVSWRDNNGNLWLFGGSISGAQKNDLWKFDITTKLWTWIGGSSSVNEFGSYGTQGITNPSNYPGARSGASAWTDNSGIFWLYGGSGYAGSNAVISLADLWKYDPTTNLWTWVKGPNSPASISYGTQTIPSSSNSPGPRINGNSVTWVDALNNLWLFGGDDRNDLWKYDSSSNVWVWMKGDNTTTVEASVYGTKGVESPTNKPGTRDGAMSWVDNSGNFWMMGGDTYFNDLWKYNLVTNNWIWMSGSNAANALSIPGVRGVSNPANVPSARVDGCAWKDVSGNLWLLGGFARAGTRLANPHIQDDLWKYDIADNTWTWMSGVPDILRSIQNTVGIPSSYNRLGGRGDGVGFTDTNGNLWLWGGSSKDYTSVSGHTNISAGFSGEWWKYDKAVGEWTSMNVGSGFPGNIEKTYITENTSSILFMYDREFWRFNPVLNSWSKSAGNNTGTYANYGTQGVASSTNIPGSRSKQSFWKDNTGNFWMFGGSGYVTSGSSGNLNDLWKYDLANNQWTWYKGDYITNSYGVYGSKGISSPSNKPGARNSSICWTDAAGNLWLFGGNGYAATNIGFLTDLWRYDPVSNEWTWMAGDSTASKPMRFGTKGVADLLNRPGVRDGKAMWRDNAGYIWLFGGGTDPVTNWPRVYNDLWRYDPYTDRWAWVKGDSIYNYGGVYGTQNIGSLLNYPGGRMHAIGVVDNVNGFYLFGGYGYGTTAPGYLNDLWLINGNALPVQLLNFYGKEDNADIRLEWQTSMENQIEAYNIQKSYDGRDFSSIGYVVPQNSTVRKSYNYTDNDAFKNSEKVFYRLAIKQNGNNNYSTIIKFERKRQSIGLSLFPNPARSQVSVTVKSTRHVLAKLLVSDALGKKIMELDFDLAMGVNSKTIEVSGLEAGMYMISIITSGTNLVQKFIRK